MRPCLCARYTHKEAEWYLLISLLNIVCRASLPRASDASSEHLQFVGLICIASTDSGQMAICSCFCIEHAKHPHSNNVCERSVHQVLEIGQQNQPQDTAGQRLDARHRGNWRICTGCRSRCNIGRKSPNNELTIPGSCSANQTHHHRHVVGGALLERQPDKGVRRCMRQTLRRIACGLGLSTSSVHVCKRLEPVLP